MKSRGGDEGVVKKRSMTGHGYGYEYGIMIGRGISLNLLARVDYG